MNLQKAIKKINLPDKEYEKKAALRLDDQARPKGSLGLLEDTARRLAGISKTLDVRLDRKIIVTCAGDHGVVAEGVSLFPQEVTAQMVYNFVDGGASINVLARHAKASVRVADLGVNHDFSPELPIFHKKIAKSTGNIRKEPAMSRNQAIASIEAGIAMTEELAKAPGLDLLGTGDMGIGNTTPSAAVIAAFSGLDVKKLAGRGTGLDDRALKHKIRVIEDALELHRPGPGDPVDVLAKVGGFEIGGLAGLVIGAAALGIPVVCDGLIATAGALIACGIAPAAGSYLFASHRSVEAGHNYMLKHLGLDPLLDLKLRLGEGTGAALAMEIMDASTRVLAEIRTFEEVQIRNAQK
ncbi:MAG: nicotinate-nucleotide--dimethylbenzimidazole phosphoribosyltransferase [Desulfobacteraceae bacterium]|nr:nicotinate-nucleotide--dimethylbenzimidazole phosphoribosyltransferase [Desulfobacteraceae bacterium]